MSGVTNRSVDSLMVSTGMGPYFSASVFGGLPSSFREENGSGGDRIYGARLAHQLAARYEIGLSYEKLEDDDTVRGENAGPGYESPESWLPAMASRPLRHRSLPSSCPTSQSVW